MCKLNFKLFLSETSIRLCLVFAVLGIISFFYFALSGTSFFSKTKKPEISRNEIIVAKKTIKAEALVSGKSAKWIAYINPKDLAANQKYIQLPSDAKNVKISTINKKDLAKIESSNQFAALTEKERKTFAFTGQKEKSWSVVSFLSDAAEIASVVAEAVVQTVENIAAPQQPSEPVVVDISSAIAETSAIQPQDNQTSGVNSGETPDVASLEAEKGNNDTGEIASGPLSGPSSQELPRNDNAGEAKEDKVQAEENKKESEANQGAEEETATENNKEKTEEPAIVAEEKTKNTKPPSVGTDLASPGGGGGLGEVFPAIEDAADADKNAENIAEIEAETPKEIKDDKEVKPKEEEEVLIAVEYETPAPVITEQETDKGKLVTVAVSEPAGCGEPDKKEEKKSEEPVCQEQLTNVLAYASIPELFKMGQESKIQLKWKNNGDQNVEFHAYDTNNNGKLDYVEWTVPHLSEQIFEIIYISKAFELDENKEIAADIYDIVKSRDGNYATLAAGRYVRITFEKFLDKNKDITVFGRPVNISQNISVEVYPIYANADGSVTEGPLIATFENINHDGSYKILLTNLATPTNVFDLKIIGDIEIDYIVDPAGTSFYWVGGDGEMDIIPNHWSASSGGSPLPDAPEYFPTASDTIIFDENSGTGTASWNGYGGTDSYITDMIVSTSNISFGSGASYNSNVSGNLTVSGTLQYDAGHNFNFGSGTISGTGTIGSNVNLVLGANSTANVDSGTLTINGVISGAYNIAKTGAGTLLLTGDNTFSNGLTIQAGIAKGTTSANAFGSGTITIGHSAGTADATLEGGLAGTFANAISVASGNSGVAKIQTFAASTFSGGVTLNTHALTLATNGANLVMSGGMTGTGNLTISSASSHTVTLSTTSVNNTGTITNNGGGSGTTTISAVIGSNVTELTQNSATSALTLSGNNSTISGNVAISAGTLALSGTTNLNVTGNWSNSGTFTANSSTVTLTGVNQSLTGNTTFNNLTKQESTNNATDSILTVAANSTQTISGTFNLDGLDDSDRLNLVSSSPGTRYTFGFAPAQSATWLDVSDANASTNDIDCTSNCVDGTNNDDGEASPHWVFTAGNTAPNAPTLVSPSNASYTTDNTPTLSANYSDSDTGDTGTTNYRISSSSLADCANNTNVVASGTSSATSTNNENTTWTPGSTIGSDATYYWCAQNDDGVATSSWTQMGNFVLDTTAPGNVGISGIAADSVSQLTITANTATDAGSGLHATPYWFNETTSGAGGSDSADWQASTAFVDSGLSANTQYTYQVKARDALENASSYSSTSSLYTLANTPNAPTVNGATTTTLNINPGTGGAEKEMAIYAEAGATCDGSAGLGYVQANGSISAGVIWQADATWATITVTGLYSNTQYSFCVKARNGDDAETGFGTAANGTTSALADAYWVGGTGNWSDVANHWATTSGGAPGAGNLPGSTTNVHWDSNSGGGVVSLDGTATVANFSLDAGTVNLAGNVLTVSGTFSVTGTLQLTGDETVTGTPTLNSNSTVEYTATSGSRAIKSWTYTNATIKINGTGGTFTLPASTGMTNLTVNAGTFNPGAYTPTVSGTLTMDGGLITRDSGNLAIIANTINQTGGSITTTTSGTISINSTGTVGSFTLFTITSVGALNIGGTTKPSAVIINGVLTTNAGLLSLYSNSDITQNANITSEGSYGVYFYPDTDNSGTATFTKTSGTISSDITRFYFPSSATTAFTLAGIDSSLGTTNSIDIGVAAGTSPDSVNITGTVTSNSSVTVRSLGDITQNADITANSGSSNVVFYPDMDNSGTATFTHTSGTITASNTYFYFPSSATTAFTLAGVDASLGTTNIIDVGVAAGTSPASVNITGAVISNDTIYIRSLGNVTQNANITANAGNNSVNFYPDVDNNSVNSTFTYTSGTITAGLTRFYFPADSVTNFTLTGLDATLGVDNAIDIGNAVGTSPASVTITGAVTGNETINIYSLGDINQGSSLNANNGSNTIIFYPNLSAGSNKAYISDNSTISGFSYTVNGDLTVNSGKTLNANGTTISATGTFTNNGTLQLKGNETVSTPTNSAGSLVQYNGASGPYTLKNWTYDGLRLSSGSATTYNLPATITVAGNLTIDTSNTLDVTGTNYGINLAGNWSNAGTFTARSGTVTLTGVNQSLTGNTTFNNLAKQENTNNSTDSILTIAASSTQTVAGTLDFDGTDADDRLNLVSSTPDTRYAFNFTGGAQSATWLDVRDANASTNDINCASNCVNGGNNDNSEASPHWIFNTAPSITANPSDTMSSSAAPTNAGSNVAFTATATDAEADNYYLAICKTDAIVGNENAAPTCGGGEWCVSSSTASGSEASCSYATLTADAESNDWYAFACDYDVLPLCSASSQGTGNNGSPFAVNHKPNFTGLTDATDPLTVGDSITFTSESSDDDVGDTVTLYVCKDNDFTGLVCGAGGEWCHSNAGASNVSCSYTSASSDVGANNYYGYLIDNHSFQVTNPIFSTFTVNAAVSAETPDISVGGSNSLGAIEQAAQIAAPQPSGIIKIIDTIFGPPEFKEPVLNLPPVKVTEKTPLGFSGKIYLFPEKAVEDFVLAPLPKELMAMKKEIPQLGDILSELGITTKDDVVKLKDYSISLPGLKEAAGLPKSITSSVSELSEKEKAKIPSGMVFAQLGRGIDADVKINVSNTGEITQKISVISNKPISLSIKPERPAEKVRGYLIYENNQVSRLETDGDKTPGVWGSLTPGVRNPSPSVSKFLSSLLRLATESLSARSDSVSKSPISAIETKLVLQEFDYNDEDNDGIFTAAINSPVMAGNYDIMTVITFKDKSLGDKIFHMITVVDPEGYVYKKIGDDELRINGAVVSLYRKNDKGDYELWNAKDYAQDNPQKTDTTGKYSFLAPEGNYYLKVDHKKYLAYKSEAFDVREGEGIHMNIEMQNKNWAGWVDLKTAIMIILSVLILVLLGYNFYKDKKRENSIRNLK